MLNLRFHSIFIQGITSTTNQHFFYSIHRATQFMSNYHILTDHMMTDAYGKVEVFAEGGLEHYVANVS